MIDRDTGRRETGRKLARRTLLKVGAVAGLVGNGIFAGRGSAQENTITVRAQGRVAEYRFTVTGEVATTANSGGGEDRIEDGTVTGKVAGRGEDTFRYSGEITSFEFLKGHAKVFINGEPVEELIEFPNRITVQAQGEEVSYRFSVDGNAKTTESSRGGEDRVKEGTVTGTVAGRGEDAFQFSGGLTSFERPEGPLRVTVDFLEDEFES